MSRENPHETETLICPFCRVAKGFRVEAVRFSSLDKGAYFVHCWVCGLSGPIMGSSSKASEAWWSIKFTSATPLRKPWHELRRGDSFTVETKDIEGERNRLFASATYWAKRKGNGWRFATAKVDGGIKITRTK